MWKSISKVYQERNNLKNNLKQKEKYTQCLYNLKKDN